MQRNARWRRFAAIGKIGPARAPQFPYRKRHAGLGAYGWQLASNTRKALAQQLRAYYTWVQGICMYRWKARRNIERVHHIGELGLGIGRVARILIFQCQIV